jgi:hypothetical protein
MGGACGSMGKRRVQRALVGKPEEDGLFEVLSLYRLIISKQIFNSGMRD